MFEKIIIGVDPTQGAHDAIKLARELASHDAELILAHVHGGFSVFGKGSVHLFESGQRTQAEVMLAELSEQTGIGASRAVGATSVGRGLHELVDHENADLVVIGSSLDTVVEHVGVREDLQSSLSGAPCAVAIAPAGYARTETIIREIGVGFDGSSESLSALAVARELARVHHATVSAFHALPRPPYMFDNTGRTFEEVSEDALDAARTKISELGGITPHVTYGKAAEELTFFSASVNLLIVGSRSYGPLGRLVHGSTTLRLAHSSRSPLLVVRKTAHPRHGIVRSSTVITTPADQPLVS